MKARILRDSLLFPLLAATTWAYSQNLTVGTPAPSLQVASVLGGGNQKDQLKNKYLVVDFWATWCAPCIAGFPQLNELSKAFRNKNVQFAVISYEQAETVKRFLSIKKDIRIDALKLIDQPDSVAKYGFPGKTFNSFNIRSIPATFVIDPAGIILWKGNSHQLDQDLLAKIIESRRGEPIISSQPINAPEKIVYDSIQIGSFNIKSGIAIKGYPGYYMTDSGMAVYRAEKIHSILLHLNGWHESQVDTSNFKKPIPYVQFNIKGDKKSTNSQMADAAAAALSAFYNLNFEVTNKLFTVYELKLKEPARLLKNAAAFDPNSGHSSGMPGKEHFYAVNFELKYLQDGILKYILPNQMFTINDKSLALTRGKKFDFKIPIKSTEKVLKFMEETYGIVCEKKQIKLPVLVLREK